MIGLKRLVNLLIISSLILSISCTKKRDLSIKEQISVPQKVKGMDPILQTIDISVTKSRGLRGCRISLS